MDEVIGTDTYDAAVDAPTTARYQPGGDIYNTLTASYGPNAANSMAVASRGSKEDLAGAMADIRSKPTQGSTSTFVNFVQQMSDPLQAPIAAAMGQGSSGPGLGAGTTSNAIKGVVTVFGIGLALYALNTFAKFKGK